VESPEFQKALNEACEGQYRGWLYGGGVVSSKDKIGGTMEEIQRQRQRIEDEVAEARHHADRVRREVELMSNEGAREITEALHRLHSVEGGLVCPSCGETNSHGNTMNGRPLCWKCQLVMISKEKAEKWVKPQKPKTRSLTFTDVDVARVRK
jgi:endogenous inhibitor of DNA gyrase (YacG/DUF329 family)